MSPSRRHENRKTRIGNLLEIYFLEAGMIKNAFSLILVGANSPVKTGGLGFFSNRHLSTSNKRPIYDKQTELLAELKREIELVHHGDSL